MRGSELFRLVGGYLIQGHMLASAYTVDYQLKLQNHEETYECLSMKVNELQRMVRRNFPPVFNLRGFTTAVL